MKTHYCSLLILCFGFMCLSLYSQDTASIRRLSAYTKHFVIFTNNNPQEKVYLHFDNTMYFLGETIWFKAYVVTSERNGLSPLSKVLYVEFVSPEGTVIESKKLKIENGQCHSQIFLKDSLYSGFYEVRAYTRYMLNQPKEYLFSRVFPVYERPKSEGDYSKPEMREKYQSQRIPQIRKESEQKRELTLSFFPEGGNLILDLNSRVAFKATSATGEDVTIKGNVINDKGVSIAELNTDFQGAGSFVIAPESEHNKAKVEYNNKEYIFDLPQPLTLGYAITVDNTNEEKIDILIQKNKRTKAESLGLSISCRGIVYGFEPVMLGNENVMLLTFPKKMIPSGVSQITLFNNAGEVLCERLVFVNHHSHMKIEATQHKQSYHSFERVDIDFQFKDLKDDPVESDFSVSVRDVGVTPINPYSDNILTNLLLSSELRGYIRNPEYYHELSDKGQQSALDLLMLTQGWCRYVWKQMAGVVPCELKQPVEKGLVIEGTVLSLSNNKPKQDVDVIAFLTYDVSSQQGICKTDEFGRFNFALTDFYGRSNLSIQTKMNHKRIENNIILDRPLSPELKIYDYYEKKVSETIKDTLIRMNELLPLVDILKNNIAEKGLTINKKSHVLPEVTIKEKKKWAREGEGLRFASVVIDVEKKADNLIDKGDFIPISIFDFISKVDPYFNCQFGGDQSGTTYMCRYKGKNVIFILNNNPVNEEKIANLSTDEIETVIISEKEGASLMYSSYFKLNGTEVVVYLYNYKDFHKRDNLYGIRQTNFQGYSYTKEFYSPQYDKTLLSDETDYRRTLYWNPDVKTDKDGKATIHFYNNKTCKSMNISAETVNQKGMIGTYNK